MSDHLIDIPVIVGGISADKDRPLSGRRDGTLKEGTEVGDIGLVEGQGVLTQHPIAIDRVGTGRHARAVAKETFLLDFFAAVGLLLIATLFDAEATIRIAFAAIAD